MNRIEKYRADIREHWENYELQYYASLFKNGKTIRTKKITNNIELYRNPFDNNEYVEWHHINNEYVIALPQDIHNLYNHRNHRSNLFHIIIQIYPNIMKKLKKTYGE
jgi:hypothetical protein